MPNSHILTIALAKGYGFLPHSQPKRDNNLHINPLFFLVHVYEASGVGQKRGSRQANEFAFRLGATHHCWLPSQCRTRWRAIPSLAPSRWSGPRQFRESWYCPRSWSCLNPLHTALLPHFPVLHLSRPFPVPRSGRYGYWSTAGQIHGEVL